MVLFPGAKLADKIGVTELNEILLKIIPNSWSKQVYVQGFDCKYITFNKAVNMFECMDIAEYNYEGEVEPSYKKYNREYVTCYVHIRKNRGEAASYHTNSVMAKSASKLRKRKIDHPMSEPKPVSYTAPGIHQTKARSWEALVLSMLK